MTKMMISARVDVELNKELEALATASQRSKAFLINAALETYVERQRWMEERIEASLKEADESGEFISNEAMMKWLDSWGTESELPPPAPDVFRKKRSTA